MRPSREIERSVSGEVVEQVPVAHPVQWERVSEPGAPMVIYVQQPAPMVDLAPVPPSRAIPWALIAVSLAILLFACFAAWHTWVGPQVQPGRAHPVDLVNPSR